MTRIVHVSDCFLPRLGGIERHVHDLAVRQRRRGDRVTVLTSVPPDPATAMNIDVVGPLDARRAPPGRIAYLQSRATAAQLASLAPDVVHVHLSGVSPLGLLTLRACVARGTPAVATLHSFLGPAEAAAARVLGLGSRTGTSVAWSTVSTAAVASLRRIVGTNTPISVVPNSVDSRFWRSAAESVTGSTAPGRLAIVSVGRLAHRKRTDRLLAIVRRAKTLIAPATQLHTVVIGDGPLRASLERTVRLTNAHESVTLLGAADPHQIRAVLSRSDVYVAPAIRESFGIAALEARTAGLPVIGFASSGIADYIHHGEDGLLVDNDSAMARAIASLADDPRLLRRLRDHNRAVPPSIDWRDALAGTDALYAEARGAQIGAAQPVLASSRSTN